MLEEIPYGYCHCGCGQKTNIAPFSSKKYGWINGQPLKFIHGHNTKMKNKNRPKDWIGNEYYNSEGHVKVYAPNHSGSNKVGSILKSRMIVEDILGKSIPKNAEVHHVNNIKDDDRPTNYVLCQDRAYHMLLHQCQRALNACGHANWLKCPYCKQYDDPNNLYVKPNKNIGYHRNCKNKYEKQRRQKEGR